MTRGHEAKWLVKTLHPSMQGVGITLEATVLPCLGRAALVRCKGPRVAKTDLQRAGKAIREAYARRGDVEVVAEAVLGVIRGGESDFHGALVEALGRACRLAPGVPPAPMLANPANSVKDAVTRLLKYKKGGKDPAIAVERKYDGQRAAIHRTASGEVRIFSRKNADMTAKYPDVVEYVTAAAPRGVAFCLDAEIVPVGEDNKPRPFQELSTRNRGRVRVALFDLLWLGAEDITSRPLVERRRLGHRNFVDGRRAARHGRRAACRPRCGPRCGPRALGHRRLAPHYDRGSVGRSRSVGRSGSRGVPRARDRRLALNHNCRSRRRGGPLRAFLDAVGRLRGGPNDPTAALLRLGATFVQPRFALLRVVPRRDHG